MAMTYDFTVVIEPDGNGFHAFVPVLQGCHSFGATVEEAQANIREAIEVHVEALIEDGEEVPTETAPYFVSRMSVPIAA